MIAVCKLLDVEKRQHNELKMTWQMANDQFLESQRLMMMDMRRMESVLSAEQQRQIHGKRGKCRAYAGLCYVGYVAPFRCSIMSMRYKF